MPPGLENYGLVWVVAVIAFLFVVGAILLD